MLRRFLLPLPAMLLIVACEAPPVLGPGASDLAAVTASRAGALLAPAPLVTVSNGTSSLEFWPFLGADFSGIGQDPVNLLFHGQSDPRALRAALLMLSGDRTAFGFPDAFPFNCTWQDAIGDVETAYATGSGWVGSAVQLACGDFGPIRFHLRLLGAGEWTIANAHFEMLVPGTATHQVLSWELAEQLVTVDLLRSGLLDPNAPIFPTGQINPSPFRDIPAVIYNGLPAELRAAIGGPSSDVVDAVPLGTDGHATGFNVAGAAGNEPGIARQDFVIEFAQVIPKPFCASGPYDYVYVQGPVRLRQQVTLTPSGNYVSQFEAVGQLAVTPVNPLTNPPTPVGDTYRAQVNEHHTGIMTDQVTLASSFLLQILIPPGAPVGGTLKIALTVRTGGRADYSARITCGE